MVKRKILLPILGAAFLLLAYAGCNNAPQPTHPLNGSGLILSATAPGGISGKFTLAVALEYRIASGSEVLSGSVSLNQLQSTAGPLNIPLPHDGQWLVSAEWINLGTTPLDIGADQATIVGSTPFNLELGTLNQVCYKASMADPASTSGFNDLFTFDTDISRSSTIAGPQADVQCLMNTDPTYPSLYFQPAAGPAPEFAYLGTGDWVNYTDIPSSAVFYNDSQAAKRAALGPTAVMAVNDVYVMKLSPTTIAWIQVNQVSNLAPATSAVFFFRVNRQGLPYLKFDVTTYGNANCNTSGVTLLP
jgi:hypothetical protein